MKIIVDTNIVFSGILNSTSRIGKILTTSKPHFEFYTCDFLRAELFKHRTKLLKLTKLPETKLKELESLVTSNITFINEALIPEKILSASELLIIEIDTNDTPFVALAKHLKAKRFKDVLSTTELSILLDQLERK